MKTYSEINYVLNLNYSEIDTEGTGECRLSKTDVMEDESLISGAPSDSASTSRLSRVDIWAPLLPEPCPHWPFPRPSFM